MGIYTTMLVITAITVASPQLIRLIIDRGIYGGEFVFLSRAVVGLIALAAIKALLMYFQGNWTEVVSQQVAFDLRNQIQRKIDALSFSFHDRMQSGQILSRSIQDVERIRFLTGRAILRLAEGLLLMLGTALVLVWMKPSLGLLVFLTMPLLVYRAYVFSSRYRPLSLEIQNQLGVLTTQIEQNLRGALVVKGFAQEEAEIERFQAQNEHWFDLSVQSARLESVNIPMLNLIANLGTVIILLYGGLLYSQGQLSLGVLVAFISYLAQLVRPLSLVGRIIPILSIAASAGERIFAILDAPTEVQDDPSAIDLPDILGLVRFEKVSFGYNHQFPVIQDISFEVQPGQSVALLGATGSGKSTIINLVTRFYNPTSGRITVDGIDTQQVTLRSLRRQIGIVLQDNWLFASSVWDNLTFGQPAANEAQVITAAQQAQAHDFILQLPDGYDTLIGERGITLSGGQKQRLAIARALLTDPHILILDDATSSVDTETERLIQLALTRLMQGRTTFVIAHRLSTVRNADLILILDKGRVIAQGTHRTLLSSSPQYAQIYQLQLRPQERKILGGTA
jgi:ATP-binding cassette subfamily B multidrug efflux pump